MYAIHNWSVSSDMFVNVPSVLYLRDKHRSVFSFNIGSFTNGKFSITGSINVSLPRSFTQVFLVSFINNL